MKHFLELKEKFSPNKPWLILGKGPTLERYTKYDLNYYNVMGLNHVSRYINVDVSLLIDEDVCTLQYVRANNYILAPYHPHYLFKPKQKLFLDIISDKIYYFDCSTWKKESVKFPVIRAQYNCAEAAFDILRWWQVKEIYTLGIDGGKNYAQFINELPLTNGQPNFNKQIKNIKAICKQGNIVWNRL